MLAILPYVIRLFGSALQKPSLISLLSLVDWKFFYLSANVKIFDSTHNKLHVVVFTLCVLKLRVVTHVNQLPQHKPLIAAVEVFETSHLLEVGYLSIPRKEVGEVVGDSGGSRGHEQLQPT
jgi:hypothetical protein